jgi:hypothetical protein
VGPYRLQQVLDQNAALRDAFLEPSIDVERVVAVTLVTGWRLIRLLLSGCVVTAHAAMCSFMHKAALSEKPL